MYYDFCRGVILHRVGTDVKFAVRVCVCVVFTQSNHTTVRKTTHCFLKKKFMVMGRWLGQHRIYSSGVHLCMACTLSYKNYLSLRLKLNFPVPQNQIPTTYSYIFNKYVIKFSLKTTGCFFKKGLTGIFAHFAFLTVESEELFFACPVPTHSSVY